MRANPCVPAVILALAMASCGSSSQRPAPVLAAHGSTAPTPSAAPIVQAPPAARPDGRLPDLARPVAYQLAFEIDPSRERFSGTTTVTLEVPRPTRYVVMHGREIHVTAASVASGDGAAVAATAQPRASEGGVGEPEELLLTFAREIPAGRATLTIAYDTSFDRGLRGLYRVQSGGRWYAFTQFEPTDARRAFPCFDEPGFKVPWTVSIVAPAGMVAVANMPEASHAPHAPAGTEYRFAPTPPMPSYLIALAVGEFDIVERAGAAVPLRAIAVRGQGGLTTLALDAAEANLRILAEYFGRPYPYAKMDIVAVPEFAAGAMENPGLVTFREEALLVDAARASTGARRGLASIVAHEFAHQWFGDLVTMAWWNDLWLNEGFATWMQARANDTWHPEFNARVDALGGRAWAMETDSLPAARAVRQPVRSTSEAMEAFDGITYQKGAAVLSMLEQWLGEDVFRAGVRAYIDAHAWGSATAQDLFTALGHAAGRDVAAVAFTFVDQPGVPLVHAALDCATPGAPALVLSQSRYAVAGATYPAGPEPTWRIPVCVAYGAAGAAHPSRTCVLLDGPSLRAPLTGATTCPAWLEPNADEAGYYRYEITEPVRALATAAVRAHLDERERVGFVQDAWALVRGGRLGADDFLRLLDGLRAERSRSVVAAIASSLSALLDDVGDDATRVPLRAWIGDYFRPLARELGWTPRAHEDDDRRLLRRIVLSSLGGDALDAATLAEATRIAHRYIADPRSVDPDIVSIAVPMASRRADAAWLHALAHALTTAPTPADRVVVLSAYASFDDPALLTQALDATLTDEVRVQDVLRVIFGAAGQPVRRATVRAWVAAHFDALRGKLSGPLPGRLAGLSGGVCTADGAREFEAFWRPRVGAFEGADRSLREGLERAQQCVALHEREAPRLAAFLAHRAPAHR